MELSALLLIQLYFSLGDGFLYSSIHRIGPSSPNFPFAVTKYRTLSLSMIAEASINGSKTPTKIIYKSLTNNEAVFIDQLKKRVSTNVDDLTIDERNDLVELLNFYLPRMRPKMIASTIYQVSLLPIRKKTYGLKETDIIAKFVKGLSSKLSESDISLMLSGLVRLDYAFEDVSIQKEIFARLVVLLPEMNSRSVGDVFWSLGAAEFKWNTFKPVLQNALLVSIERCSTTLNAHGLSSTLWSLARLGIKWIDLVPSLQRKLLVRCNDLHLSMSPQQSSKVIWALGSLNVPLKSIPDKIIENSMSNIMKIKKSKIAQAIPACQSLTGIAKLGINWDKMSPSIQLCVIESLLRICQTSNFNGISNSLWAIGTVGVPISSQSTFIRESILEGAMKAIRDSKPWAICNIIWGLTKMGFRWHDLSLEFKSIIASTLKRIENELNAYDIGILLWSLGNMETPINSLSPEFRASIYNIIERLLPEMKPQDLAHIVWSMSSGGVSWDMLPTTIRWGINGALRRLGTKMSNQDIANTAYGLACICFDAKNKQDPVLRGAHEAMLVTITNTTRADVPSISFKEKDQLRIFAHYVRVLKMVDDVKLIPKPLLLGDIQADKVEEYSLNRSASRLQSEVVRGLHKTLMLSQIQDIEIIPELSGFQGIFPVDAAILFDSEVVALLEVDGPQHYRDDGQLRRKDQLKEAMYKAYYPESTFHRISWVEANIHGSGAVGAELASQLLVSIRKRKVYDKSIGGTIEKYTEKLFAFFEKGFSWSLRNSNLDEL